MTRCAVLEDVEAELAGEDVSGRGALSGMVPWCVRGEAGMGALPLSVEEAAGVRVGAWRARVIYPSWGRKNGD